MNHIQTNVKYHINISLNYLIKIFFQIYFNFIFLSFLILSSSLIDEMRLDNDNEELIFTITEELPKGTIIASGKKLGNLYLSLINSNNNNNNNNNNNGQLENSIQKPRILNIKDRGVKCFNFQWCYSSNRQDNFCLNELQLIVNDRIDRETICPLKSHELTINDHYYQQQQQYNTNNNNNNNNLLDNYILNTNSLNTNNNNNNNDCIITLRIAIFNNDNIQKIYQIHIIIEDINDNPPEWNMNKITIYFHDNDPPGTKQSIPLAKDVDIGKNAKITYELVNINENINISKNIKYSYILDEMNNNNNNNNNIKIDATDIFELVIEERTDIKHFNNERLFLISRYTLDRELQPQGWDLILLAKNNENSIKLTSQLYIHINITDVNDNTPKFLQSIYKPQLPNYKIGIIPENFPIGKTILHVYAIDADEGRNAKITYSLAPNSINHLIDYFFEMTYDGQLRVIRPLNVDIITEHNITRPYLPTNIINFDIIAVDDAGIAYSKTGYATIQLQVENIDDEAPEIKIHPIQSIQKNFLSTNHQLYETEIEVLENQPPNQLIALIEVKDPDCISYSISQCILTGVNAIDFRLSYQHSMNNEYRLYTVTKLDREKQSNILLSIECKDLTNHITSNNIIIHILDTNDHAPKCSEQLYHFALYEDDNELDHLDINLLNRSWFTSNQLAFISVNDEDIGINAEITYYIPIEFEEKLNGKISIDSKTGQLFAWGPFDREQISIYEFIVIATDSGQPIKFSTNCSVIVKILDINDNPPLFHTQLSITGGYLFSIHENQLPGTRVGQIQAYDLDLLPATTHITDLFTHLEKSDLYIPNEMNTIVNNIDKRLVYSLKNELNSQAFRIDPKTGVIITRTILDREIQSTYTFYAYVHDGPDQSNQTSSITTEKSKIQATKGNNGYNQDIVSHHRSHTASIMITITIQDENDNDPVFIRPNSTNHMILLNPSAIPGQSLSQLLATDPDEGLNGQVTYAIKGETAGTLFNVDPRTGLLYLESQIPRQYISNTRRMADNNNHNNNNNNNNNQNQANDLLEVSTYPTFLLALDACDQGEPKRCTHFPNLQIQIRSSSNIIDEVKSSHLQDSSLLSKSNTGTISLASSSSSSSLGSGVTNFFRINSGIINPYLGKYSLVEILIIGFSIFFSLLILIILFIVFIIRRRTQQLLQNNEQINPELLKLNHSNSGFNVELHEKRKEMNNRTRKICNWNFSRSIPQQLNSMMTINTSDNNTNSMQPINCNQPVNVHPLTLSTLSSNSQMFNQKEMTYQLDVSDSCILNSNKHHAIHYNQYNPIFINSTNNKQVVSDDYQSLDCWNDITTNYPKKFIQSNLSKSSNLNLPPFYMRELKQPIIGNNSNVNFTNNIPYTYYQQKDTFDSDWKSNKTSYITSHNDMNNTHNSISNENITICTTNNNNSQHNIISKNKENIHTYTGYLKSSFV